jgi:hypothetical protein
LRVDAPLNEEEVAVVMRIVKAAAWYVSGGDEMMKVETDGTATAP